MVIEIDLNNKNKVKNLLNSKLIANQTEGNLFKHFGKLKRSINGLEYQKKMRKDEN